MNPHGYPKDDDLQDLLRKCYVNQQNAKRMRRAQLFAWGFTLTGLGAAGFCYLVKFNHWFGVR